MVRDRMDQGSRIFSFFDLELMEWGWDGFSSWFFFFFPHFSCGASGAAHKQTVRKLVRSD